MNPKILFIIVVFGLVACGSHAPQLPKSGWRAEECENIDPSDHSSLARKRAETCRAKEQSAQRKQSGSETRTP